MESSSPFHFAPDPACALLLLVDIQERLVSAVPPEIGPQVVRNAGILTAAAREFNFPVMVSEQYPRGLGPTVEPLRQALPDCEPIEKVEFNCCKVPGFVEKLAATGARDIILCGIEAHVCVLQTAFGLHELNYRVFVAADGAASLHKQDWKSGMTLMQQAGIVVATTQIYLFGMIRAAGSDRFKRLAALVK